MSRYKIGEVTGMHRSLRKKEKDVFLRMFERFSSLISGDWERIVVEGSILGKEHYVSVFAVYPEGFSDIVGNVIHYKPTTAVSEEALAFLLELKNLMWDYDHGSWLGLKIDFFAMQCVVHFDYMADEGINLPLPVDASQEELWIYANRNPERSTAEELDAPVVGRIVEELRKYSDLMIGRACGMELIIYPRKPDRIPLWFPPYIRLVDLAERQNFDAMMQKTLRKRRRDKIWKPIRVPLLVIAIILIFGWLISGGPLK